MGVERPAEDECCTSGHWLGDDPEKCSVCCRWACGDCLSLAGENTTDKICDACKKRQDQNQGA